MVDDDQRHPVGGVDFPRTLQEFDEWFASEDACTAVLRIRSTTSGSRLGCNLNGLCE